MRRPRLLLAAALALAGWGLVSIPTARAADADKHDWWYRLSSNQVPEPNVALPDAGATPDLPATLPPPADIEDGQLLVEGTPEGATAIAGATWRLDEGDAAPSLTLTAVGSPALPPDAVILACRAATPWPASGTHSWDDKPLVDCGASVQGIVSAETDSTTVSFGLAPLLAGRNLDVVFVPGVLGETFDGTNGSSFRLVVEAPDGDDLTVVSGGDGAGDTTPVFTVPTSEAPIAAGGGSFTPPAASTPGPSPTFTSPSGDTVDLGFVEPVTPVAAPALDQVDQGPSVPRLDAPAFVPAASVQDLADPARKVGIGFLVAAAIVAAWAFTTGAATAEPATVGLGRFERPTSPVSATAAVRAARDDEIAPEGTVMMGLGRFRRPVPEADLPDG